MKIAHLSIGLLALFSPLTAAWSKEGIFSYFLALPLCLVSPGQELTVANHELPRFSPDREIFRIRDEIAAHEADSAATFYDTLGITRSASQDDITKAFRQKTRTLHPDKVKQKLKADRAKNKDKDAKPPSPSEVKAAVKEAEERQTRLSLIAKILRGPGRDRYNHFLENGFPLWKGTDYYYDRYRPGLGTAITGVLLLCGGAVHYLILYMNWKRQREFVERYIRFARDTAWGPNMNVPGVDSTPAPTPAPAASQADDEDGPPQPRNRKQRRMQEKETKRDDGRGARKKARKAKSASSSRDASAAPTGARKRVVAENGKILVVDSLGNVYLEDQDEEGNVNELLLDVSFFFP